MKSTPEQFGLPFAQAAAVSRPSSALESARAAGAVAAQACTDAAQRRGFDVEAARAFVLGFLRKQGPTSGESLTTQAIAAGHSPHDARAFGVVFSGLNRRGLIRCAGFCLREKGRGTAGGRIWEAVPVGGVKP